MENSVMRPALDVNTWWRLYEQARWGACGQLVPAKAEKPLTLGETIQWARLIPRSARVAQGYLRITDFARHVKGIRAERAKLRERKPDPLRREILDKLDRIMAERHDLFVAARREAKFWWSPRVRVWWQHGKPRPYDSVCWRYRKTDVAVPATWLFARLDKAPNIALRLRKTAERAKGEKLRRERLEEAARLARNERARRLWEQANLASAPATDAPNGQVLVSPMQRTEWHDSTLRVDGWSESDVVRGQVKRFPVQNPRPPTDTQAVELSAEQVRHQERFIERRRRALEHKTKAAYARAMAHELLFRDD
jgi:hypothetical protein